MEEKFKVIESWEKRCTREKQFSLGNLVGGFVTIAIATACLGVATKSLKDAGVMN